MSNSDPKSLTGEELAEAVEREASYRDGHYCNETILREAARRLRELAFLLIVKQTIIDSAEILKGLE